MAEDKKDLSNVAKVLRLARAVCFGVDPNRVTVALEPFRSESDGPWVGDEPAGWRARIVLYANVDRAVIAAVLAEVEVRFDPLHKERRYDADTAMRVLLGKMRRRLREARRVIGDDDTEEL
jgi:hypothetical protein